MKSEWVGRSEFTEVAEVLRISTDMIMAEATPTPGLHIVFFTKEHVPIPPPASASLWTAVLKRGEDGTLEIVNGPNEKVGALEDLHKQLSDAMKERFSDGDSD